jgi:hypothetical protein
MAVETEALEPYLVAAALADTQVMAETAELFLEPPGRAAAAVVVGLVHQAAAVVVGLEF